MNNLPRVDPIKTLVRARLGESVETTIAEALALVADPKTAYAYFQHNWVIVTVDKNSTPESAYADWVAKLKMVDIAFNG